MNKIQLGLDMITTTVLNIGFEGEQNHTEVCFYWTTLRSNYPNATASLAIKSPTGEIYPKVVTTSGNKVTWEVSASDCAHSGSGQYQLTFTNGDEIIKTYIGNFRIQSSIIGNGTPPDPIEDWLEEAQEALNALEAWDNVSASATTLSPGASATAEVTEVEGHKNFAFGLPSGASGEMVVETVTGSTPSITGVSNHRYICGTCSTLSITPPESGIIDVVFTSGSTATVLTVPNTVTFPAWFDKANLEANVTYEINIADGYGVVCKWA